GVWERLIIAVSRAIQTEGEGARLLILQFVKERVRDADRAIAKTLHVRHAGADLAGPEIETTLIRLAAEKIQIIQTRREPLFERGVPQQLAANLAVGEVLAVYVHVVQAGLQVRDLLRRGTDCSVDHGAVRQREDDRRRAVRVGWTMNVRGGLDAAQT